MSVNQTRIPGRCPGSVKEYTFWRNAYKEEPPLYTKVLVYRKDFVEYGNKITIGQLIAGYGDNPPQWEDLSGRRIFPLFWMPLPDPPGISK